MKEFSAQYRHIEKVLQMCAEWTYRVVIVCLLYAASYVTNFLRNKTWPKSTQNWFQAECMLSVLVKENI